jgi:hypothetical protein
MSTKITGHFNIIHDLNKPLFFVLAFFLFSCKITAQDSSYSLQQRHKNVVFMNVGGGATYISFEYERLFGGSKVFFLSAGAGLGSAIEPLSETVYSTIPFHISGNLGHGVSFFEFGTGRTLISNNPDISYLILGYRLSLLKRHKLSFSLRLNFDIPFNLNRVKELDAQFIPLELGLGIAF